MEENGEEETSSHQETTSSEDTSSSETVNKLEHENQQLRTRLEKTEHTMSKMLRQMELQKTRTRQLIAGWKLKIQEGEDKMAAHSKEKDEQLANLLSQLMFFEGCLKKEREEIMDEIKTKTNKISDLEKTVKHQKRQIDALNRANERLLTSLHDTMNGRTGPDTGEESDESSSCNSSSEEQSSISDDSHDSVSSEKNESTRVIKVRRKASMPALSYTNGNIASSISKNRPAMRRRNTSHVTNGRPIPIILTPTPELPGPESSRRRVHFDTGVNNNREERYSSDDSLTKSTGRLRKISLPAYRLPSDEEGSIRYF